MRKTTNKTAKTETRAATFSELVNVAGLPLKSIWPVLCGAPAEDKDIRVALHKATGLSQASLLQPIGRMRCRTLELLSRDLGVHKTTVFRILRGEMRAGINLAVKLSNMTGIPTEEWMRPSGNNWMLVVAWKTLVNPDFELGKTA